MSSRNFPANGALSGANIAVLVVLSNEAGAVVADLSSRL
jgi:hypothetical protein